MLALNTIACPTVGRANAPREQRLTVMSYNIQYGNEGIDSVIAVINAERPDIVGLQEVDVHWEPRSRFSTRLLDRKRHGDALPVRADLSVT